MMAVSWSGASGGLWAAIVRNGEIAPERWQRAIAAGDLVGTCRSCGGYVVPDNPPDYGQPARLSWYTVRCQSCGHEAAAPGGRVLRGSGRLGERTT